jgi:hypothetical protein
LPIWASAAPATVKPALRWNPQLIPPAPENRSTTGHGGGI